MPKKVKAAKSAAATKVKSVKFPKAKAAKSRKAASAKPKASKARKTKKAVKAPVSVVQPETAELLSSEVVYQGRVFRVCHDKIIEPGGLTTELDVIRHNGSAVILAVDSSKNKKNPWIVIERQYRHAANQFLWELPAGKIEPGEDDVAGAKRELSEETGYSAKKWKLLVQYFASPGFLGETMKIFLAEGLVVGDAHPDADEQIEIRLVKLSDILRLIQQGAILDGKTITGVLLYARSLAGKRKK